MSKPLERLSNLLSIDIYGFGQDWELVYADPRRLEEYCDLYEREPLNPVERRELMRLIIASCDRMLEEGLSSSSAWERVARLLRKDFSLHRGVVEYWSLPEETDEENVFAITPLMREIWRDRGGSEI